MKAAGAVRFPACLAAAVSASLLVQAVVNQPAYADGIMPPLDVDLEEEEKRTKSYSCPQEPNPERLADYLDGWTDPDGYFISPDTTVRVEYQGLKMRVPLKFLGGWSRMNFEKKNRYFPYLDLENSTSSEFMPTSEKAPFFAIWAPSGRPLVRAFAILSGDKFPCENWGRERELDDEYVVFFMLRRPHRGGPRFIRDTMPNYRRARPTTGGLGKATVLRESERYFLYERAGRTRGRITPRRWSLEPKDRQNNLIHARCYPNFPHRGCDVAFDIPVPGTTVRAVTSLLALKDVDAIRATLGELVASWVVENVTEFERN